MPLTVPGGCRVQTGRGKQQASDAGYKIRRTLERENGSDFQLYFYTSPYMRSFQTFEGIRWGAEAGTDPDAAQLEASRLAAASPLAAACCLHPPHAVPHCCMHGVALCTVCIFGLQQLQSWSVAQAHPGR